MEFLLSFAFAYWTPDESKVALYACGGAGGIELAYDVKHSRIIPFQIMQDEVRKSMLASYPLLDDGRQLIGPVGGDCNFSDLRREYVHRYPTGQSYPDP
jgi:hypothetical protein